MRSDLKTNGLGNYPDTGGKCRTRYKIWILTNFLEWISGNPISNTALAPLQQFLLEGGSLKLGELISECPFYCSQESSNEVCWL